MEFKSVMLSRKSLLSLFVICILTCAPISADEPERVQVELCIGHSCPSNDICNNACKKIGYTQGGICKEKENRVWCCCSSWKI
ncbi:hypothetical protein FRX31_006469 [Thalictrum thalictroides]|uniref:Defensin-like protein n=1 Tax=Thalictrum thalictroides TaxID=46969 RepID=A0A7J6X2P5_THATH|nr:hypothetical protein FRX31_006469 [Thalictrum thalictroides]